MCKITISTPKGYPIVAKEYSSSSNADTVVIIVSATGVKQSYYTHFANYLESENIIVYTFDYGGIGLSKTTSLRKFNTSATNWGQNDLESVIGYVKGRYPNKSVYIIGHSIGGQLIGLARSSYNVDKILLIAAQTGYWKFWKGGQKWKMIMNWYFLFPILTRLWGYFPGKKFGIMEDLPKGVALEWRKWCVSKNYLFDHINLDDIHYNKIESSLFSYSASDDIFAPKSAVDWLSIKYKNANLTRRHLTPKELGFDKIGHFGFFKTKYKERIWKQWLTDLKN